MSDYNDFLKELDITEKQIQFLVNINNVKDTISDIYHKSDSKIHGVGVFASKNIKKGEIIGDVSIKDEYRTTLGRWINHSKINNVNFKKKKDGINMYAVANRNIIIGEEILVNYRHHTVNDIDFLKLLIEVEQIQK